MKLPDGWRALCCSRWIQSLTAADVWGCVRWYSRWRLLRKTMCPGTISLIQYNVFRYVSLKCIPKSKLNVGAKWIETVSVGCTVINIQEADFVLRALCRPEVWLLIMGGVCVGCSRQRVQTSHPIGNHKNNTLIHREGKAWYRLRKPVG